MLDELELRKATRRKIPTMPTKRYIEDVTLLLELRAVAPWPVDAGPLLAADAGEKR